MKCNNGSLAQLLRRIAPNLFAKPLGSYPCGNLHGALAGALASIPQTLAFGLLIGGALGGSLSGVGVLIALYGSVLLGLSAAILGGCPFLVAGPRASSLLIFTALIAQLSNSAALAHLPNPTSVALILACIAVLGSGMLQLLFGAFRIGRLANYVPFPVMSGFVNGSALLIILSQICPAMGISEQKSIWAFFDHLHEIKPATLALSLATAALMLLLPRMTKRVPPMPFAFIAGTAAYHLLASFGFADALGGTIPPLPEHYALHFIGNDAFANLSGPLGAQLLPPMLAAALSMSILSSLDTLFATAAIDEITMRRSNAGRQLMAEGFGNALAGMFGMAPGSGALARTKAALGGGMQSAAAPVGIALITLVVALALGPAIGLMSQAVMAGLLIALGIDLIDKWTLTRLRRLFARSDGPPAMRSDMIVVAVVVATALIEDLTAAVGIGVVLSVLLFITQMTRNPVRRSYRATALIPRIYGDIARQRSLEQVGKEIAVIELEGILFFGTASELESHVELLTNDGVSHVVLDMRRVHHIDATGARALERLHARLSLLGGMLAVSHVDRERRQTRGHPVGEEKRNQSAPRKIWAKLADFGTIAMLGNERFLSDTDTAVALCEKQLTAQFSGVPVSTGLAVSPSPVIRSLDRPMLRRLRGCLIRAAYQPGDVIFLQGSAPDGAFFVASGRVEVMINLPGTERKRKVQSLTSGSIFGEMALIDPNPRSASIVAVEPTVCYYMSSANFGRLKREQSDVAFALLTAAATIFAERLRATNMMVAELEA
jgi:SulP family sulfate permease